MLALVKNDEERKRWIQTFQSPRTIVLVVVSESQACSTVMEKISKIPNTTKGIGEGMGCWPWRQLGVLISLLSRGGKQDHHSTMVRNEGRTIAENTHNYGILIPQFQ
jgi:hypothetical protein